jgi:phosphoenolpyruvate carboxylase
LKVDKLVLLKVDEMEYTKDVVMDSKVVDVMVGYSERMKDSCLVAAMDTLRAVKMVKSLVN